MSSDIKCRKFTEHLLGLKDVRYNNNNNNDDDNDRCLGFTAAADQPDYS